ncbi:MAG: A/G-specific adenine glycosylase [Anaerolineae bacterium]|nr:A/G-specific adenine glycosylase [Anaerolineae bacterium]
MQFYQQVALRRLLEWFASHARDLPWRYNRTPYRVWVSEVMLQQTQVETVHDYYLRFMDRFPTIESLAAANLEEVLKMWEGLGYYSRARSLHRAAQEIVQAIRENRSAGLYEQKLPADVNALRELPGIGAYTAGAIASIAFNIPTPAIDGNVRRVLSRVLALKSPTQKELEAAVTLWLPREAPGTFNEALMELGAVVCRPKSPRCRLCPWMTLCRAQEAGQQEAYPAPKPKKTIPHYDVAAAITLQPDGQILVAQRRQEDMLGGMWEFPGGKRKDGETIQAALQRELMEEMGIEIAVGEHLITVRHAYTHFRITLYAFICALVRGEPRCIECADFRWITVADLDDLPMAVTDRKIAQAVKRYMQ